MDKEADIAALTAQAGSFSFYLTEEVVLSAVSSNKFSWCYVFKKKLNLKVKCVIAAPNGVVMIFTFLETEIVLVCRRCSRYELSEQTESNLILKHFPSDIVSNVHK